MAAIDWSQYKEEPNQNDWSQYKETQQDKPSTWESLYKGVSEAYPATLKYGANALSQPFGMQPFQDQEEQPTTNWPEYLGRGVGKLGGALTLGVPFALGGEALIPGLAGASLGSGLAGAALTQGTAKDRSINGLLSAAIPGGLKGLGSAFRIAKSSVSSVKPRLAADVIQQAHDVAQAHAIKPLEEAAKMAASRKIPAAKINNNVFSTAKSALGDDQAVRELIAKAKTGDYQARRDLQSDMAREARILADPSKSRADRLFGKKLEAARNSMNQADAANFEKHGSLDLAENIREGMKRYAEFKDLYYKNPRIAKLVGPEKDVPVSLNKLIRRDTGYFAKLRDAHPELKKLIQRQEDKELIKKMSRHVGYKTATAAAVKSLVPDSKNND